MPIGPMLAYHSSVCIPGGVGHAVAAGHVGQVGHAGGGGHVDIGQVGHSHGGGVQLGPGSNAIFNRDNATFGGAELIITGPGPVNMQFAAAMVHSRTQFTADWLSTLQTAPAFSGV